MAISLAPAALDRIRGRLHEGPSVVEAPAEAVVVASPREGDAEVSKVRVGFARAL